MAAGTLIGTGLLNVSLMRGNLARQFGAQMAEVNAVAAGEGSRFGSFVAAGLKMVALGTLLTGAAAAAAGALAVKMAADFQESMTQLVTGAGESQANLGIVSRGILKMAGEVGVSAGQLAQGMYMIESAGFHGAQGLAVLKAAAEGARVGNADMATVANAVTSALNAYGLKGSDATAVTNDLIATVANGKMHMEDLAGALGTILPEAAALKVPLSDITAAIATMTMQGTDASTATQQMRFLLTSLVKPTNAASDALKSVGLTSEQVGTSLTRRGLQTTLQMITDALGKKFKVGSSQYLQALAEIVGGTRGLNATLELTGSHTGAYKSNIAAIIAAVRAGGGSITGWARTQQDFNFQLDKASAAINSAAIQLGQKLLPYATRGLALVTPWIPVVADLASRFVDWLVPAIASTVKSVQNLSKWVVKHQHELALAATIIGVLLTPAIVGWSVVVMTRAYVATLNWLRGLGMLATSSLVNYTRIGLSTIAVGAHAVAMGVVRVATIAWSVAQWLLNAALTANPIGLVIVGIALLVAGIVWAYKNVGWFHEQMNRLWDWLKHNVPWFTDNVILAWTTLTDDVALAWQGFQAFGKWLQDTFGPILDKLGQGLSKVGDFLNYINPFARHSPSLVEQVEAGTKLIVRHYGAMADAIVGHAGRAGAALGGLAVGPGGAGAAGSRGGAGGQVFNFYGDVKPDQGVRLGRDIAWELKGSPR